MLFYHPPIHNLRLTFIQKDDLNHEKKATVMVLLRKLRIRLRTIEEITMSQKALNPN